MGMRVIEPEFPVTEPTGKECPHYSKCDSGVKPERGCRDNFGIYHEANCTDYSKIESQKETDNGLDKKV
jgi:hypothetical protein